MSRVRSMGEAVRASALKETGTSKLIALGACSYGLAWYLNAQNGGLKEAWYACERVDWLAWYVGNHYNHDRTVPALAAAIRCLVVDLSVMGPDVALPLLWALECVVEERSYDELEAAKAALSEEGLPQVLWYMIKFLETRAVTSCGEAIRCAAEWYDIPAKRVCDAFRSEVKFSQLRKF